MLSLRDYQVNTINVTRQGFARHQRQLMVLPTGGGKTVVFSEIVAAAAKKGTRVLVLTDRNELHISTIESMKPYNIRFTTVDANSKKFDKDAIVYISMVETFKRRFEKYLSEIKFDLIIADEAHMGNFSAVYDLLPEAKVIGATATPVGKHLYKYFTNIIQEIDTPDLVEQGFLVPCKPFQMVDDFSDLKSGIGDFSEQSNFEHFDKKGLYDGVIKEWTERANGVKTIVFCVNIEHTINTCQAFKDAGISSEFVTSNTPKEERERILKAFSAGYITVLVNCGILTKGYNEPSIQCVIVNRATTSLALWLQMVGRGSRLYPGKKDFLLLDFGGNHTRPGLGMWNKSRVWELKQPKKKTESVAPCKSCKSCQAIVPASARVCEFCGSEFEKPNAELKEGVMIEVKPEIPEHIKGRKYSQLKLMELLSLSKMGIIKSSMVWRIVRAKGADEVRNYANIAGYKGGWVKAQLEKISDCDYYDKTIN
jgi:superfamily II DNA or RNA helicase